MIRKSYVFVKKMHKGAENDVSPNFPQEQCTYLKKSKYFIVAKFRTTREQPWCALRAKMRSTHQNSGIKPKFREHESHAQPCPLVEPTSDVRKHPSRLPQPQP